MAVNGPDRLINIVAPALRALLAKDDKLRLIRCSDSAVSGDDCQAIELAPEASPRQTIDSLTATINNAQALMKSVCVKDTGTFTVLEDQAPTGRVVGKVAFVTGAAQGIGLGIARDLLEQGACVILADINDAALRDEVERLSKLHGTERAKAVTIDVTDNESVRRAIDYTVRTYGGLDIFVSNAGVLKAESVKTQPLKDFDIVTAVNYRGYFLCVQKLAQVLAVQHLAKPDYFSDIIQINSKSGLVGSNRNSAYAGSKFGGIGLTQSFALELIADGIKVNSICPGNFFDGPLWSDPRNGLFAQYLRAEKVPGAKTVQDVRKSYEAKVPMGRGCAVSDIMHAVYYIIDQKYETGQALPVTGGQIMLH